MIKITKAPPYLTVQNGGRNHWRASGVPSGGAMDSFALQAGNAMVGNELGAAGLEWALGGGTIRFERDVIVAFTGGAARMALAGKIVPPCTTTVARAGEELVVEQITGGRFLYFAFSGGVDVPVLLGSRSTYLPGHFGGFEGRMLRSGDTVALGTVTSRAPAEGFHCAADLLPRYDSGIVHVVPGPQGDFFDESEWRIFLDNEYRVAAASDRTGYRLDGPPIGTPPAALPSEPGCPGTIQVPGDGAPIVLMADAPTVGGYMKIAVVSEADLPILAQRRPGETIRFERTSIEQSQRAFKRRRSDLQTISQLASRSTG